MKIRQGFVSNSSSASFIIKHSGSNDEIALEYYEMIDWYEFDKDLNYWMDESRTESDFIKSIRTRYQDIKNLKDRLDDDNKLGYQDPNRLSHWNREEIMIQISRIFLKGMLETEGEINSHVTMLNHINDVPKSFRELSFILTYNKIPFTFEIEGD